MKHLIISQLFSAAFFGVSAQVTDSTIGNLRNLEDTSHMNMNPNNNMNMDSARRKNKMNMDISQWNKSKNGLMKMDTTSFLFNSAITNSLSRYSPRNTGVANQYNRLVMNIPRQEVLKNPLKYSL